MRQIHAPDFRTPAGIAVRAETLCGVLPRVMPTAVTIDAPAAPYRHDQAWSWRQDLAIAIWRCRHVKDYGGWQEAGERTGRHDHTDRGMAHAILHAGRVPIMTG